MRGNNTNRYHERSYHSNQRRQYYEEDPRNNTDNREDYDRSLRPNNNRHSNRGYRSPYNHNNRYNRDNWDYRNDRDERDYRNEINYQNIRNDNSRHHTDNQDQRNSRNERGNVNNRNNNYSNVNDRNRDNRDNRYYRNDRDYRDTRYTSSNRDNRDNRYIRNDSNDRNDPQDRDNRDNRYIRNDRNDFQDRDNRYSQSSMQNNDRPAVKRKSYYEDEPVAKSNSPISNILSPRKFSKKQKTEDNVNSISKPTTPEQQLKSSTSPVQSNPRLTPPSPTLQEQSFGLKYKRDICIGQGRYGQVWKARSTTGNLDQVALKRTSRNNGQIPTTTIREAKFLMQLDHPNICKQHEIGAGTTSIYSVLDYCHFDLVGLMWLMGEAMDRSVVRNLAYQLSQGLLYLHERGIVHRVICFLFRI